VDVGLDRAHGALDNEVDADRRGEVVDDVGLVDELRDDRRAGARLDRVAEAGVGLQMAHVVDRARRQIVEDVDSVTPGEQVFSEKRADESRPAGYEKPQFRCLSCGFVHCSTRGPSP
jgi:hypothetical protein